MTWYTITAKADISEIWLYDEIGFYGIGAKEFIADLNAVHSPKIALHINSPGGEVFEGNAIYNALKRHAATVTTYIDGLAASIASVIALAGEQVIIAANGLVMLHNPSGLVMGTADDMRRTAGVLDKIRDTMVGVYAGKSGKTEADIKAILDSETWYSADEAKDAGFVDVIADPVEATACARYVPLMGRYGYKRIPRSITDAHTQPKPKELERALQDAGCTASMAKAILAAGYPDRQRDAAPPDTPSASDRQRDAAPPMPARIDHTATLIQKANIILQGGQP